MAEDIMADLAKGAGVAFGLAATWASNEFRKYKAAGPKKEPTPDPQRAVMIDVMHDIATKLGESHERMDRNHEALLAALNVSREDHGRIEGELRDIRRKAAG